MKTKNTTSAKSKPKLSPGNIAPMVILAGILAIAGLHYIGAINLSGFINPDSENYLNVHNVLHPTTGPKDQNPVQVDVPSDKPNMNDICDAIYDADDGEVGKTYELKFKADVEGSKSSSPFRFFIFDSSSGSLPPGTTLYPDGRVSGIPTKPGTYECEICTENDDTGDCFCIRIYIRAKTQPAPIFCYPCPTTSCEAGNCCCTTTDGIMVSGVSTLDCCTRCPGDTHEVGKDVKTPGGPYKICKCNACN